jgi:hypothetical protein
LFGGDRRREAFGVAGVVQEKVRENALIDCMDGAFVKLPEVVQRAHRGTIRLSGTAQVERGRGLGGLIAAIMRLPKSNPKAELIVTGWHFPDKMVWSRTFDGRTFESTFTRDDDFLVERMGLLSLYLQPKSEGGRLVYRLIATQIGPIALPAMFAPSMTAWEAEREGRYEFEVSVNLPLLGRMIRYAGSLDLEVLAT